MTGYSKATPPSRTTQIQGQVWKSCHETETNFDPTSHSRNMLFSLRAAEETHTKYLGHLFAQN